MAPGILPGESRNPGNPSTQLPNAVQEIKETIAMQDEKLKDALTSIEMFMNRSIFQCDTNLRTIQEALVAGRLVLIRDAMHAGFAERMFQCLDRFDDWRVYEKYEKHFHFHHHNIYEKELYPPDLAFCNAVFASQPTKDLMQRLSHRDCSGGTAFSASWYLPGDHSLPHTDNVEAREGEFRQLAFVWHLTKDWQPTWGGDLFWCPANVYLPPTFNSLILFTVGRQSHHFVTQVSSYSRSKRLAINGWWTGTKQREPLPAAHPETTTSGEPFIRII
jgi:hypothetical protein